MPTRQVPRKRAARNSLSREAILQRAVAVLDEKGPSALTMRALAEHLEVGPMALYTYFPSKNALLDAARDHVLRELADQPMEGDWTDRLRCVGLDLYRLLVSHPALIHLFATRPLAGHEAADATEAHLRVLREAGFDRVTAARAHLALLHHVLGSATWDAQLNSGEYGDDDRHRRQTALQAMSADRYPTLIDLATELVTDAIGEQQFTFGLELILTGLRARLNQKETS